MDIVNDLEESRYVLPEHLNLTTFTALFTSLRQQSNPFKTYHNIDQQASDLAGLSSRLHRDSVFHQQLISFMKAEDILPAVQKLCRVPYCNDVSCRENLQGLNAFRADIKELQQRERDQDISLVRNEHTLLSTN
jgi:hypothetical protein